MANEPLKDLKLLIFAAFFIVTSHRSDEHWDPATE
jgi:hypothetical protein